MLSGWASVRATCRDWRFSAKASAAWQPRRTASDARENSGALSGSKRPMKGRSPGGRLAGLSTAAHNAGLNKADKAKQNWVQGPAGMAGAARGGGQYIWAPPPLGTPQTQPLAPPRHPPTPTRWPRRRHL